MPFCFGRVEIVRDTADVVELHAFRPNSDEDCAGDPHAVELPEPLGDCIVIDHTGEQADIRGP